MESEASSSGGLIFFIVFIMILVIYFLAKYKIYRNNRALSGELRKLRLANWNSVTGREFAYYGDGDSPLTEVLGYHVGAHTSLTKQERHEKLKQAFLLEIPSEPKFQKYATRWGRPLTYRRYAAIAGHLKSEADKKRSRQEYKRAVSEWDLDRFWFINELQEEAEVYRRGGFKN